MKFILIVIVFLIIGCTNAKSNNAYESCNIKFTKISIKFKKDFRIVSITCDEKNPYVINSLEGEGRKIFINKNWKLVAEASSC